MTWFFFFPISILNTALLCVSVLIQLNNGTGLELMFHNAPLFPHFLPKLHLHNVRPSTNGNPSPCQLSLSHAVSFLYLHLKRGGFPFEWHLLLVTGSKPCFLRGERTQTDSMAHAHRRGHFDPAPPDLALFPSLSITEGGRNREREGWASLKCPNKSVSLPQVIQAERKGIYLGLLVQKRRRGMLLYLGIYMFYYFILLLH